MQSEVKGRLFQVDDGFIEMTILPLLFLYMDCGCTKILRFLY